MIKLAVPFIFAPLFALFVGWAVVNVRGGIFGIEKMTAAEYEALTRHIRMPQAPRPIAPPMSWRQRITHWLIWLAIAATYWGLTR